MSDHFDHAIGSSLSIKENIVGTISLLSVISSATYRKTGTSWSYSSWIYIYLWSQCRSPLTLCFQIPLRQGVLDTTLCDKVCQWLVAGWWFSPCTPVSSTNKTDCNNITFFFNIKNLSIPKWNVPVLLYIFPNKWFLYPN